jgi:BRCA1-associated protein
VNHWKESQHCYSLDLETQRVWDYVGDGYVHRLIQSKTDGKLVELPAPCRDGSDDCSSCEAQNQREDMDAAIYSSKLDAIKDEYDHLLTTQLESQRKYYEGRLAEMEEDREAAIQHAVEGVLNHKMRKLQARCEKVEMENRDLKEVLVEGFHPFVLSYSTFWPVFHPVFHPLWTICCQSFDFNKCFFFAGRIWL